MTTTLFILLMMRTSMKKTYYFLKWMLVKKWQYCASITLIPIFIILSLKFGFQNTAAVTIGLFMLGLLVAGVIYLLKVIFYDQIKSYHEEYTKEKNNTFNTLADKNDTVNTDYGVLKYNSTVLTNLLRIKAHKSTNNRIL